MVYIMVYFVKVLKLVVLSNNSLRGKAFEKIANVEQNWASRIMYMKKTGIFIPYNPKTLANSYKKAQKFQEFIGFLKICTWPIHVEWLGPIFNELNFLLI